MNKPSNKQIIKKLYEEYKKQFLNELYDTPLKFENISKFEYVVFNNDGKQIALFKFRFMYDVDNSPINYKKYKINKYLDVNWDWINGDELDKKDKNFIKLTSTTFKVIEDFIRNNNYPLLLGFGGLTEQHNNIYSNSNFIERWNILLGERYKCKYENDKLWIMNKIIYGVDETIINKYAINEKVSFSEMYRQINFPIKQNKKGIARHDYIKEQIKRIILKQIYLK